MSGPPLEFVFRGDINSKVHRRVVLNGVEYLTVEVHHILDEKGPRTEVTARRRQDPARAARKAGP